MSAIVARIGAGQAAPRLISALRRQSGPGHSLAGLTLSDYRGASTTLVRTAIGAHTNRPLERIDVPPALQECGSGIGVIVADASEAATDSRQPATDCTGGITVVHTGGIRNARALGDELLAAGHHPRSGHDSWSCAEIIAHLVEEGIRRRLSAHSALDLAVARLDGNCGIIVLEAGRGHLAAAAHGSPLVHARTANEAFIASDVDALPAHIHEFRILGDGYSIEARHLADRWRRRGRELSSPQLHSRISEMPSPPMPLRGPQSSARVPAPAA
ncbi:hypothetical protein [Pseudoclavibacter sp. AY1H1]|uniref:hypothetical protein n=1 Tax=Pseudoclavibacter sp. AY1H1 TaxID=2080584 RepID=UPI0015E3EA4B|nr:hypothetical protein [Pseudoclavibacter sp. AY1H1]